MSGGWLVGGREMREKGSSMGGREERETDGKKIIRNLYGEVCIVFEILGWVIITHFRPFILRVFD
jgi:hypothetical protein